MSVPGLKEKARLIFTEALQIADAHRAVCKAVSFSDDSVLKIGDKTYDIKTDNLSVYSIAVGKAAYPMAAALDEILNDKLAAGIISGVLPDQSTSEKRLSAKWRAYAGGHPLPNEASLAAARDCLDLLRGANNENSLVIFLISGGGSAMLEAPCSGDISLAELRETNFRLVTCGASISEINKIRKALSRVKGGGLAMLAPRARQVTLIISDTGQGDEISVASGPTIPGEEIAPEEIDSIIKTYNLSLPPVVLNALRNPALKREASSIPAFPFNVLLNNQTALKAAARAAENLGYHVEIAPDIDEQNIAEGCAELLKRIKALRLKTSEGKKSCLISGGEFACSVRGNGIGGRNSETVLRMAILFDEHKNDFSNVVFISAGTDGIDGGSPAAGAVCDENTLKKARRRGMDAQRYLENSDSYSFFKALGDDLTTGATGTNVRDLRVLLAA